MNEAYKRMAIAFQSIKAKQPTVQHNHRSITRSKQLIAQCNNTLLMSTPLKKYNHKDSSINRTHTMHFEDHNSSIYSDCSETQHARIDSIKDLNRKNTELTNEISNLKQTIKVKNSEINALCNEIKLLNDKLMRLTSFMTSPHNNDSKIDFPLTTIKEKNKTQALASKNAAITNELEECKICLTKERARNKKMKTLISRIKVNDHIRSNSEVNSKNNEKSPEKANPEEKTQIVIRSLNNEQMLAYLYTLSQCQSICEVFEVMLKEVSKFITYDYLNIIIEGDQLKEEAMKGNYVTKEVDTLTSPVLIISSVPDVYGEPYYCNQSQLKYMNLQ